MGMSVGSDSGEDEVNSEINTTPLVDVMLVLLIIFLITTPVIADMKKVSLPAETNEIYKTKPENITISIDKEGSVYWNGATKPMEGGNEEMVDRLKSVSVQIPQPEVHIRGDKSVRYEFVGKTILAAQRAGIAKVAFVITPPPRN
jgi:biopolymer transport protein ExbD